MKKVERMSEHALPTVPIKAQTTNSQIVTPKLLSPKIYKTSFAAASSGQSDQGVGPHDAPNIPTSHYEQRQGLNMLQHRSGSAAQDLYALAGVSETTSQNLCSNNQGRGQTQTGLRPIYMDPVSGGDFGSQAPRTSQSKAHQLSRLKNRPPAETLAVSGPAAVNGQRHTTTNACFKQNSGSKGAPLKNKLIHKGNMTSVGSSAQKVPLMEKPRNFFGVSETDLASVAAANQDFTEEDLNSFTMQKIDTNGKRNLINLNPVLQTRQRKVKSVLRSNAGFPSKHYKILADLTGQQTKSSGAPSNPVLMQRADFAPYRGTMMATDSHQTSESQMRQAQMGFYTANSNKLFSNRNELMPSANTTKKQQQCSLLKHHGGTVRSGKNGAKTDLQHPQMSLNDTIKDAFNLPSGHQNLESKLPGISDHSPNNQSNPNWNQFSVSGFSKKTKAQQSRTTRQNLLAKTGNSTKGAAGATGESEKKSKKAIAHGRSVSQPRQMMQPRQRNITQRVELDQKELHGQIYMGTAAAKSKVINGFSSPQQTKGTSKSVIDAISKNGLGATASTGFLKSFSGVGQQSSGTTTAAQKLNMLAIQPSLSPYMVNQYLVNKSAALIPAATQQSNQIVAPHAFGQPKHTNQQAQSSFLQLAGSDSDSRKLLFLKHQQQSSVTRKDANPLQDPRQSQIEKRQLAAKRISKIYEVPSHSLRKLQHKSATAQQQLKRGAKSTDPRLRQHMQLHQNQDLGSLVQINEDSIMSTSIEPTGRQKHGLVQAKYGFQQASSSGVAAGEPGSFSRHPKPKKQNKEEEGKGALHHLNSWSLAKGPPVPSIENYIVNIDGTVKGTLDSQTLQSHTKVQPKKKLNQRTTLGNNNLNSNLVGKAKKQQSIGSKPSSNHANNYEAAGNNNLHEASKMSSIHEIAKLEPKPDDLKMAQGSIQDGFERFEQSLSNIDTKFNILNTNLVKYKQLTESARKALISRETTAQRQQRSKMGVETSSGFPTDRILEEGGDSSMLYQVDDLSNTEGGFGNRCFNATSDERNTPSGRLPQDDASHQDEDYVSDFEQDQRDKFSPASSSMILQKSSRTAGRGAVSKSKQTSIGCLSPPSLDTQKIANLAQKRAGGPISVGNNQQNTARSSSSLVTVNSVITPSQRNFAGSFRNPKSSKLTDSNPRDRRGV